VRGGEGRDMPCMAGILCPARAPYRGSSHSCSSSKQLLGKPLLAVPPPAMRRETTVVGFRVKCSSTSSFVDMKTEATRGIMMPDLLILQNQERISTPSAGSPRRATTQGTFSTPATAEKRSEPQRSEPLRPRGSVPIPRAASSAAMGGVIESLLRLRRTSGSDSGTTGDFLPSTELIAAIDQGTQSTRVYLFNRNQQSVASHQVSLPQIRPQPG
jgi:hypothetical protein